MSTKKGLPLLRALVIALIVLSFGLVSVRSESLGSAWSQTTAYPTGVLLHSCVANADFQRIYCIGGSNGIGYSNSVEYASISSSGSIGIWSAGAAYPQVSAGQSCVAAVIYIYCVGGYDGSSRTTSVNYAQPAGSGLGAWTSATAYPFAVELQSCAAYNSVIYCVGGFDGLKYHNQTYLATVSSSGAIGAWSASTSYPTGVEGQSCVINGGYIYCIGGSTNGGIILAGVSYAPLSGGGGIGAWANTTPYPTAIYNQSCTVQSGYVYCVGGFSNSGFSNGVYYASLSPSGGVGPWVSTTAYPVTDEYLSCIALSGYIYCVAGFNGSALNSSYSDSVSSVSPVTVTTTTTTTTGGTVTSTVTSTVTTMVTTTATSNITQTSSVTSLFTLKSTSTVTSTVQRVSSTTSTITSTTTATETQSTTVTAVESTQTQSQSAGIATTLAAGVAAGGLVAGVLLTLVVSRLRRSRPATPSEPEELDSDEEQ
ncbi:MAG: hypothetical protein LYZ70_04365 [Nitrososphaerales archaeon]|nr:hypothetical protein [Nitrososphaerales archaeon]